MKQKLVVSQEVGGMPEGDDQQVAGVASFTPTLQNQCLSPAKTVDGGQVGRAAMPAPSEAAGNKPAPKQNGAAAAAKAAERESRPAGPRKARTKRSNKAAAKAATQPAALVTPTDEASGAPVEEPQIKPTKTQRRSYAKRKGFGWKQWSTNLLYQTLGLFHKVGSEQNANSKRRKPPGVRAKEAGTRLKRGAAVQIMVYPKPATKAALVKAAREHDQSLSSFLIVAGLEKAARRPRCKIKKLVPQDEFRQYV